MTLFESLHGLAAFSAIVFWAGTATPVRASLDPSAPPPANEHEPLGYVRQRNVLLIVADDFGVDQMPRYIDYYGATARTDDDISVATTKTDPPTRTPTLDRLGQAGVTFLNAWSSPVCSPTRAGLFTGRHSFRHGVYLPVVPGDPDAPPLPIGTRTIANVLEEVGYESGLFGKWHLGEAPEYRPSAFGWAHHAGTLGGELPDYDTWEKMTDGTRSTCTTYATWENALDASRWIRGRDKPWMVTVAFNAPHSPVHVPPLGSYYSPRFAAKPEDRDRPYYRMMVESMDRSIAELLGSIPRSTLEVTTIVFMGDNGTAEGISTHFPKGHNKGSCGEGGINAPVVIADGYAYLHGQEGPSGYGRGRIIRPGRYETHLVQTLDLYATIAEIGRGDASCGVDSVSLVPYLEDDPTPLRSTILAETLDAVTGAWQVTVRGDTYKLMIDDYAGSTPSYQLFDLSTDRWETSDLLAKATPGRLAITMTWFLRQRLEAILAVPLPVGCE